MNNIAIRSGEVVDIGDMAETDIFQMLMMRDNVEKSEFFQLCDRARHELSRHQGALTA